MVSSQKQRTQINNSRYNRLCVTQTVSEGLSVTQTVFVCLLAFLFRRTGTLCMAALVLGDDVYVYTVRRKDFKK